MNPIATITTSHSTITMELYPDLAPNTVRSFISCALQGIYNDQPIRRIVPGFVLQPSYSCFEDQRAEFEIAGEYAACGFDNPIPFGTGTVAMGGEGDRASGSCFFITLSEEAGEKLSGRFAAFGRVIGGWEEVERLSRVELKDVEVGVSGVIVKEPVETEYMVRVDVDLKGETYDPPVIL